MAEKTLNLLASLTMLFIYAMAIFGTAALFKVDFYKICSLIFSLHVLYQIYKIGKTK